MKKLFAALLVVLCGAASLFADDVADVKAVIFKNHELQARHDFAAVPALYSPDYLYVDALGECRDYVMLKLSCAAMDGKHPEEFLQYVEMLKNNCQLPSPETMAQISQMALDPAVVRLYKTTLVKILAYGDKELAAWRRSVKFVRCEVKGDLATVVAEYDGHDPDSGAAKHKIVTMILRRKNGVWRFYREIDGR